MTFDDLIGDVLKREGGYVNHKDDRGGATNMGITQRTYSMWRNTHGGTYADVRDITREEAKAIYRYNYWSPAKCDLLPGSVRDIHFDAAVNHGPRRAAQLLQDAVRVEPDGAIGQKTLAAVAKMSDDTLRARYIAARYRFYGEIIQRDRSQLIFMAGWMRRMEDFA